MTYNRSTYGSILYNSIPQERLAVAKSIISAHTGPHIQAVVGSTGTGISFISDFIIRQESSLNPPPSAYFFPDLSAFIRAFKTQTADIGAFIYARQIRDLAAKIFPVGNQPELLASINPLIFTDLQASIFGMLAEANLAAKIQATEFVNILAKIAGVDAPTLGAKIGGHFPANLGAIIWAPAELRARIAVIQSSDLGATIRGFSFKDLTGRIAGFSAPTIRGLIKCLTPGVADLPAFANPVTTGVLSASIFPIFSQLLAEIIATGSYKDLSAIVIPTVSSHAQLGAALLATANLDLSATIGLISIKNLSATIGAFSLGAHDKFLSAILQSVNMADLGALITALAGTKALGAFIQSTREQINLGATIRVDETFITTILTIITMMSSNLGATIGNPNCDGGSASKILSATATVQQALNLGAFIQSFLVKDLGASINSNKIFHAFDTINIHYTRRNRKTKKFRATDSIAIRYSPFRGKTLGAFIFAQQPNVDLSARITAGFPLMKVSPFTSRITALDLRIPDIVDIEEVRLEMEGQLNDFLYVNGTQDAFILDANQQWKINIRSFIPIAENLFGDFALARICRVSDLQSFETIDEAVRYCINAVLGSQEQQGLFASIVATGTHQPLRATIGISDTFTTLGAIANRVFPSDPLSVSINPTGQITAMQAIIMGIGSTYSTLSAAIDPGAETNLSASITGI